MKMKFRDKMVAMTLALMMSAAPVGSVFAAEDANVAQPDRPVAESYKDNDKIEDYNKKVDEYNKAAKEHNDSVDKEYNAAAEETARKNAEIDQHNAAEEQRVSEAEARNAAALAAAEEENEKIAAENEAEKARVDAHNAQEDELVRASVAEKEAIEKSNEEAVKHNEAVDKYEADMAQYEKDLAKYKVDLSNESKIKAAGYASVEQYNQTMDKYYNTPAKISVEKNSNFILNDIKDTYNVTEAAEKSGTTLKVRIHHYFEGTDIEYLEEIEIDRNDTIEINPIAAALGSSTSPGYASFYCNTDENHVQGYWLPGESMEMDNARHSNWNWNCGASYEISYKDGSNHVGDLEDIDVVYGYSWYALRTVRTIDPPVAPTAPVDPGQRKQIVDVPEIYKAQYETFEAKPFVVPVIEKIAEADLLSRIADPVRGAYMAYLSHMDLFDVPAQATPAAARTAQAEPAEPQNAAVQTADTALIADQTVPMAESTDVASPAIIEDNATPLAAVSYWALLNLIMTVLTVITSAVLLVGYFGKKENEEEGEEEKTERKGFARIMSIIPAIGAVIVFILTENMSNPMVLIDRWTLPMAAILLVQVIVALIAKKSSEDNDDDEMAEPMNA